MATYSVSLAKILKDHQFEPLFMPKDPSEIFITSPDVHRPGLTIAGYDNFFDCTRINFLGKAEVEFINSLVNDDGYRKVEKYISKQPACIIIARNLECPKYILDLAPKYGVPVLKTNDSTSRSMAAIIAYLNVELAERITRHGVFVEVYGEGVLILGDSGVGKSETAIELVKRGHRLIADDAVEIRKVSNHTLVGQAPENIRHFIELRGVGIINIARAYGSGAVKNTQGIDMVIELENWNPEKNYSTTGLNDEYMDILGISVIKSTVPVRPGRNLSIIIETAAITNRQKKMGYNPARELLSQLGVEE